MMSNQNYVRLPIRNAYNIRDLGGYSTENGSATKWRTFLRADDLAKLDAADMQVLLDYGVSTIIDLRSGEECAAAPNPFDGHSDVKYHNIPLMDNVITGMSEEVLNSAEGFIANFYIGVVDSASGAIGAVFNAMADAADGAVLFHCAAGKDRTGIIAALLLGLAGVQDADIIANYEVTYTYIRQNPSFSEHGYHSDLLLSQREYIENTLHHIEREYIGISEYLQSKAGVTAAGVHAICDRFCG